MAGIREYKTVNPAYTALPKLHTELDRLHVPHEWLRLFDGWQILIVWGNHVISAVQHFGSYGQANDLIEMAGYGFDGDVAGWMTVNEALDHIKRNVPPAVKAFG